MHSGLPLSPATGVLIIGTNNNITKTRTSSTPIFEPFIGEDLNPPFSQGGGPGPYQAPVGMTVSNASNSLPHTPYKSTISGATIHSWRAGRWYSMLSRTEISVLTPFYNRSHLS